MSQSKLPGDNVRWYAEQVGWRIARRNIVVEGDIDVKYLELAARLYEREHGLVLLNSDLAVVAAGFGNDGGTSGLIEKFPTLKKLIDLDVSPEGKRIFRAIALVDDDAEGNKACQYLTGRYSNLRENYDVFRLKRILPRESQDPIRLAKLIKEANEPWNGLNCEIEDLLSLDLLNAFIEEHPRSVRCAPKIIRGGHHFDFLPQPKSQLCRWVSEVAEARDVTLMIETLMAIRYYLGLDPIGSRNAPNSD